MYINDILILKQALINAGHITEDDLNVAKEQLMQQDNQTSSVKIENTIKKLEVPYNFDLSLIDFIIDNNYKDSIETIYIAPFRHDYAGAKRYYSNGQHPGILSEPTIRSEYENHIKKIISSGLKLTILFQNPEHVLTIDLLNYYVDLGINSFIVNNDETAKMIKQLDYNFEVIASITKKLSFSDFENKDLSMYDKFVLYFPFNRSLDTIKKLPTKYKYILLVNCGCGYTCAGAHHWFAGCDENGNESKIGECQSGKIEQMINILPTALKYFDQNIYGYKLQGREYPTENIKLDIEQYSKRKIIGPTSNWIVDKINEEIKKENMTIEEYYNVATASNNKYII